jgi:hypothetical protein
MFEDTIHESLLRKKVRRWWEWNVFEDTFHESLQREIVRIECV